MSEPTNQPPQPVPVKVVLPRWLTRGIIIFFIFCFVLLAALAVYSIYLNKQANNIYPPEEQRRMEEKLQKQVDNSRRMVEELLHPSPTPTPARKDR
jgi:hypothetical protein